MENHNELKTGFWYSERAFPLFVALLSSGIFAGTHMYYVYHVGAFNDIAIIALLEAGKGLDIVSFPLFTYNPIEKKALGQANIRAHGS